MYILRKQNGNIILTATVYEHSSWRLLMPLGMFCFAQKVLECYRRGRLLFIMLCYEINAQ